jgi:toxin ParE1/3/4
MSHSLIVRSKAVKDFEEISLWYREKSEQVEDNFKHSLRERLHEISENPEAYSIRFERGLQKVRAASVKKFPYLIFYTVHNTSQTVRVIAIWHESRDREILKKRY